MWASESNIKSHAASLKKFYDFMSESGEVELHDVNEMKKRIKAEWVDTIKRYDDLLLDIEDVWQWKSCILEIAVIAISFCECAIKCVRR